MNAGYIISLVVGVLGAVYGLVTLFRNKAQDDAAGGRKDGTTASDIGYIKAGVDDIKIELKDQRKTNMEVISRLTAVEESAKQAHKRIDELKHE